MYLYGTSHETCITVICVMCSVCNLGKIIIIIIKKKNIYHFLRIWKKYEKPN